MPNVESATVRAGEQNYLFYNRDDKAEILYERFTEKKRDPKRHAITIGNKTDLSLGGAITAIYIKEHDTIHVYYIAPSADKHPAPMLAEVCLRRASTENPEAWTNVGMDLNKKKFRVDKDSLLCSTMNEYNKPRVFYNTFTDLEEVNFAEFKRLDTGGNDWVTTGLTGISC
jgi:hypothetical protein